MSSPRAQALAYRIWAYCQPREWDVTIGEIAEALDESMPRVRAVMVWRGWSGRVRVMSPDWKYHSASKGVYLDANINHMQEWS